jgi:2-polyprenyl-6-methoxyphenol hydroxylase-like FAD-dependent oxidoreductase
MTTWDVLVVGAGPAGSACSKWLAERGLGVCIVAPPRSGIRAGESLPGAAYPLLRDLGLLAALQQSYACPCHGNLSAWGSEDLVCTDFIRDPNGMGWHLEREGFDLALHQAALAAGAVHEPFRIETVRRDGGLWQVGLSDGRILSSRFLVEASGRSSIIARRLRVPRHQDTPLVALYAWGQDRGQDQRSLVESTSVGWWYSASVPGNRRVLGLHVQREFAAHIQRKPQLWAQQLAMTRYMREWCDANSDWTELQAYAAGGAYLERFGGEQWLAIGDAALAMEPLSSQGLFNALYTGLRGAQAIAASLRGNMLLHADYCSRLQHVRQAYLRHTCLFYAAESRWPDQPFWKERHTQSLVMLNQQQDSSMTLNETMPHRTSQTEVLSTP